MEGISLSILLSLTAKIEYINRQYEYDIKMPLPSALRADRIEE
jgi:hypothetical protein